MNLSKVFSTRALLIVLLTGLLLLAVVDGLVWIGLDMAAREIAAVAQLENQTAEIQAFIHKMQTWRLAVDTWFLPASCAAYFIFSIFLWIVLKLSTRGLFKAAEVQAPAKRKKKAPDVVKTPEKDSAEKEEARRRTYLYLLSLLQREGRLMDFFSEDLDAYEDEQIGAAVRNIHQNCKKAVLKNLAPTAVIDKDEGEEITVEPGFDPNSIKLTGNVAGDPPFRGILRHKGWRVQKVDLPTLSSVGDPGIVAPAEVEIL